VRLFTTYFIFRADVHCDDDDDDDDGGGGGDTTGNHSFLDVLGFTLRLGNCNCARLSLCYFVQNIEMK